MDYDTGKAAEVITERLDSIRDILAEFLILYREAHPIEVKRVEEKFKEAKK